MIVGEVLKSGYAAPMTMVAARATVSARGTELHARPRGDQQMGRRTAGQLACRYRCTAVRISSETEMRSASARATRSHLSSGSSRTDSTEAALLQLLGLLGLVGLVGPVLHQRVGDRGPVGLATVVGPGLPPLSKRPCCRRIGIA